SAVLRSVLLHVERIGLHGLRPVRKAEEKARQAKRDVARVVALAEALPVDEPGGLEDFGEVARFAEVLEALQAEEIRVGRGDEWRVRGGRSEERRVGKEWRSGWGE